MRIEVGSDGEADALAAVVDFTALQATTTTAAVAAVVAAAAAVAAAAVAAGATTAAVVVSVELFYNRF